MSANLFKRVHHRTARHTVARAVEANLHKTGQVDKSMLVSIAIIASDPESDSNNFTRAGAPVQLGESLPNGEDLVGDARWHRADDDVGDDIDSLPANELAKKMTGRRGGQTKGVSVSDNTAGPDRPQGKPRSKRRGSKDGAAAAANRIGVAGGANAGSAVGKFAGKAKELHQHGAASTATTYTLVIVIGCAPGNFARRAALRATWLQWAIEAPDVMHLFFTENIVEGSRGYTKETAAQIQQEHDDIGDIVFQDGASGYGKENGRRELFHVQYMLERYKFKYYLRVDDDGFLCLAF